jgi:hypothetical protein
MQNQFRVMEATTVIWINKGALQSVLDLKVVVTLVSTKHK